MSRWLQKLERFAQPLAVPHVFAAIVVGQVFFYLVTLLGLFDPTRLYFAWGAIFAGEWWRLLTFVVAPPDVHWVWFAFAVMFLWSLGSALEQEWGTLRFNLFLLLGAVFTLAAALLTPNRVVGSSFIAGSIFLAFAYLNPNHVFHLYLILPVKAKWLAALALFFYAYSFVTGNAAAKVSVLAALGNCLVFLGPQMLRDLRTGRRQVAHHARQNAARREEAAAGPRHVCVVCGKNSDTHPHEDFRYRADDRCYCSEHLKTPVSPAGSSSPAGPGR
jgi:membrane associated rhomboid family serine protease